MNHKLKLALLRSGKHQHEIAQDMGITETRMSRIVVGRVEPTDEEKEGLSRLLNTPIRGLFAEPQTSGKAGS